MSESLYSWCPSPSVRSFIRAWGLVLYIFVVRIVPEIQAHKWDALSTRTGFPEPVTGRTSNWSPQLTETLFFTWCAKMRLIQVRPPPPLFLKAKKASTAWGPPPAIFLTVCALLYTFLTFDTLRRLFLLLQGKDKEKDSKKGSNSSNSSSSHRFVSVCYSNSTVCDVCSKSMANKSALRCESKWIVKLYRLTAAPSVARSSRDRWHHSRRLSPCFVSGVMTRLSRDCRIDPGCFFLSIKK